MTTKIHALVDALGNSIHIHLSAGNVHDATEAPALIEKAQGENLLPTKATTRTKLLRPLQKSA
ncbi:MAG: transposase, partial [Myxococcales bacterium]|nr:transposase [Myxococcales bacterium]